MYHSTALLLADGSLMVSGSNPNKDVTDVKWGTSYVVERWYPTWYNEARPTIVGSLPKSLTYGGDAWTLSYTPVDKSSDPAKAKVVVIRSGFSTHGVTSSSTSVECLANHQMNFGQRYLELETSYTKDEDKDEITLNVAQMPPNANLFQPGPAYVFLVVDGIPAQGEMVMIGSGAIETQTILAKTVLPQSQVIVGDKTSNVATNGTSPETDSDTSSSSSTAVNAKNSGFATLASPSALQTLLLSLTFGIAAFVAV